MCILNEPNLEEKAVRTDDKKITPARARGSSRFSSKSATSTEAAPPETSSSSSDATSTKTSRRAPGARRTSSSRSGVQITSTVKTAVEQTLENSGSEPTFQSKPKINHHGLPRFASRTLVMKVPNAEPDNNVHENSKNNSQDISEKKFSPSSVRENTRTGRARDFVDSAETSKVKVTGRGGNRRTPRLQNDKSNSKFDTSEPSVFTGTIDNSRSRTGRKILNSSVKQSNSGTLSNPRYARNQRIDDSNPNLGAGSNRRSFAYNSSDFRKRLTESRLKQDIAASGSESVRFNLPLNFEEPKRLSSGGSSNSSPTTEISKRPVNSRYKPRGRQPLNEKKQESDTTTSNPVSRGTSRRTGNSKGYESTTEGRGRNRGQEIRKNNVADSSSTTVQPDFRRRNSNTRATARSFDTSRNFDNNRISEAKSHNIDRKSNRSRGRYRVEIITTDSPPHPSTTIAPRGPSVVAIGNIGNITPTSTPEVITTLSPPTTSRAFLSTSARPSSNDNEKNENGSTQQNDQRRRASKEDFFNHGLGFRGRRPSIPGVDQVTSVRMPENSPRGNPGWTLRRRPGHVHDGPLSGPVSNPALSLIPGQQNNRMTTASTIPKSGRRGNKMNIKAVSGGTKEEINENDNYPPDFKARLAQLDRQLYTSSNLIGNVDLDLASSDNIDYAMTQSPFFHNSTIEIPNSLDVQQANKTMSTEQFAARSKMKLENARKLIKPELLIDETNARQVIVDPSPNFKEDTDQKPRDSAVDEDQKVFKVTRKSSPATSKPESGQKSSTKSDWKPSKLRKNFKDTQTRASRYKQLYTPRPKTSLLAATTTERNFVEDNVIDSTTQSARADRYKEHIIKFVPKVRGSKVRGPKPSHENSIHEDIINSTTKSPLAEKSRKTFTPRKSDKSHVDDIKAVALKLRKTLENMEKSQTPRPVRRSDSLEGSTTLLTTMRTVKSFSFSTRLVKMDDSEAATSSTMKMLEDEVTSTTESTSTTFVPTTTNLPVTTEITTQISAENEVTTFNYESVLTSSNRPSTDDIANEIDNAGTFSTTELSFKSTGSPELDWKIASTDSPPNLVEYKPRAAALSNDSGSPVFVVYPSATEKPLSIAITPKVQRYQATIKPNETELGQQSVTQEPVISVKVSSGNETAEISIHDSNNGNSGNVAGSNIFNPVESAAILESGNATLLEHLRSTVAPLLNTLGNKSPVFAGVYKNTNSANSLPRATPSGAPPRFSARYRGAELFVRRPTPPTTLNSLTENEDEVRPINISSPGEPKILTFYQAVETASVNNEQTDVRQLWQLPSGALIKNNTANDHYDTNSSNNDSRSIIPITNTFNDISPVYINNASTHNVPDTINSLDTTMNTTTLKTTQNLDDNLTEATSDDQLKETTTSVPTTSQSILIVSKLENIDPTTASTTSTSTELMTEVSVHISENVNQNQVIATTSPSPFVDSASVDTNKSESSAPAIVTEASFVQKNSTYMPSMSTMSSSPETTTINSTETLAVTQITPAVNLKTPKSLDDSNYGPVEVSNSLLDITLSTSNNETTKPTIMEIRIGQETEKTAKLKSLAQVTETSKIFEQSNFTTESTTEMIQSMTVLTSTKIENSSFEMTSPSQSMTSTSTDTQMTSERCSNCSPDTNESILNTQLPMITSSSVSVDKNQNVTMTLPPEIRNLEYNTVTNSNNMSKTTNIEIKFYDAENATVPAGIESPLLKDILNNKEKLLALEKLMYLAINLTENNSSDNNLNNKNITEELLKIAERFSQKSTDMNESSFNENNVDSSPEELSQLVGSFVDNQSQSVTNESTVETNNETTVVTQTTTMPTTTIITEPTTNTTNANINADMYIRSPNTRTSMNSETKTFSSLTTTTTALSSDNITNNSIDTNFRAQHFARMLQILSKLMNAKPITDLLAESKIQELDLLTPNPTDIPSVVEDVTKTVLENDSNLFSSLSSTTTSSESETNLDLITISPTMLTPLQGSTPSTAQRTAGTTNRSHQPFTTSSLTTTPLSSSVSSSTSENSNDLFSNNQQSPIPTTTTTSTILPTYLPSSSHAPSTMSSPADYSISKQQPTTSVSFVGQSGFNEQPVINSSSSSSTITPVRDYLIYGILPNKTIVRKRPEDNLIDARNVDSPYVIFGIFPDGKLVRKFPNGTVIPDPPSNPVEVVFSLSTTTNRPSLPDNQFINQESRNKNFGYFNNHSPVDDGNTRNAFYEPNEVDNVLSISGPTGFNLPLISVGSGTKKMTATVASDVTLDNNGQGGRIIQDKIKDEVSKISESNGQRNSVFVGQEKFVNYWTNGQPNSNPTVLSVNLTSTATASKEGSLSAPPEVMNLDIIPNSESANRVTAPPGFPWKDPLDQIFGISSDSPALKVAQTVNTINEAKKPTAPVEGQTIDNLVEVFNPISSTISSLINTPTKSTTTTTTISATLAPITQTSATTTLTTQVPTTSRPTFSSTTVPSITMNPNLFGTKFEDLAFLNALLEKPNPGEATPKTLSEVERLLANKILSLALGKGLPDGGPMRSPKAIQASNASPNTVSGDKAFKFASTTPSFTGSSSQPIIIDLQPSTTTKIPSTTPATSTTRRAVQAVKDAATVPTYTIATTTTTSTTAPSTTTTSTTPRTTTTSTTPRTTRHPTTKAPVIITAKSVTPRRPRPTTQAPPIGPFAFAANLLQTIFGRNPFAQPVTSRPVVRKPVPTARKVPPPTKATATTPVTSTTSTTRTTTTTTTTRAPHIVLAESSHTPRSIEAGGNTVDITGGQSVVVTNTIANTEKPIEVTPKSSKVTTSTFSPEEDAKFLAALLELARNTNDKPVKLATSTPKTALDADDEAFLRAILTDQAKIQPLSTAGGNDQNDAALLAAFLKSQGIEPSTPPNSLRQQLQQASKTTSTTTRRPTITKTTTRRTVPRRPPASISSFPSAYPPPLFSNFGVLSGGVGATTNTNGAAEGNVRSQVVDAAIGMTRAFGQFLGAAITGAAQQFQSFIRNGTRWG
ncbi:uncharacterized protein LOC131663799 [Phymastichus coffea]|uniref:uncharacterized protein LOC131663799 n=1 Tax=Phymastichus coffea TaxID=108790 RepID=UPI00273AFD8D|nr:uncharacterized protein LOC131663799 [Phymastichus coffea]